MAKAWAVNADAGVPAYSAQELRRLTAMYLLPGVGDRFGAREGVRPTGQSVVDASGTTWTQRDLTAVVYPGLTSASGPYVVEKGEESGQFDPADGTNDRIDALDLLVEDDDEDASGNRQVTVVYVAGTPAGTPTEPPLTTNALRIGTFDVPAGGTPSPSVRDEAEWTVALGGILPVRDDSESPTTGRYAGMYRDRADSDLSPLERWNGSAWTPAATYGLLPNGAAEVTADQGNIDASTTVLTGLSVTVDVPANRRVLVMAHISMFCATPPGNFELRIQRNGSEIVECGRQVYGSGLSQPTGFETFKLDTPGSGSHTYRLVATRVSSGGGDGTMRAHSGDPAFINVFDGGPV